MGQPATMFSVWVLEVLIGVGFICTIAKLRDIERKIDLRN